MSKHREAARHFLELADRDIRLLLKIVDDEEIDIETIGFHAQQAVEKCLKAILTFHDVPVRKTHDLLELSNMLRNSGISLSVSQDDLQSLTPYAVEFRYGDVEEHLIPRETMKQTVLAVREWAGSESS